MINTPDATKDDILVIYAMLLRLKQLLVEWVARHGEEGARVP